MLHSLYILTVFEGLLEVADVTGNVHETLDGKGYYGDEAKGKPRMRLDDVPAIVATVVAPTHDALVAFNLLAERVLAAREDETHGCGFLLALGGPALCS